jgi:hypothetical protein
MICGFVTSRMFAQHAFHRHAVRHSAQHAAISCSNFRLLKAQLYQELPASVATPALSQGRRESWRFASPSSGAYGDISISLAAT